jgi:hypothetical protein
MTGKPAWSNGSRDALGNLQPNPLPGKPERGLLWRQSDYWVIARTLISTRRLRVRPSSVALVATGWLSPMP